MNDLTPTMTPEIDRWSVKLLRREITDLKREHQHLQAKSQERTLTGWESERLEGILDELVALMNQLANFGRAAPEQTSRV